MTIETRHRSEADPGPGYGVAAPSTRPAPTVPPRPALGPGAGRVATADGPDGPGSPRPHTGALLLLVAAASAFLFAGLAAGSYAAGALPAVLFLVSGTLLGGTAVSTAAAIRGVETLGGPRDPADPTVGPGGTGPDVLDATAVGLLPGREDDLILLAELGRAVAGAQDADELLEPVRALLDDRFAAERLAVFALEDDRWYPQLVVGSLPTPEPVADELPLPFDQAALEPSVLRLDDLLPVAARPGSGLYARLIVDGMDEGLIGVEHPLQGHFDDRDVALFEHVAELVGLGLHNARAFTRLRSVAAAEERARIARDLHDRLGQWLTYISLELERLSAARPQPDPEMERLQRDVRSAIDELRNALVELRTTIRAERPLAAVLPEVVERFAHRTGLQVELSVADPAGERLGGVVENELLRIVQESLTNIEKHADATDVHISYAVDGGRGVLTIEDNGRGFDPTRGIRSTAYGLVGMRERAAAVGAIVEIASQRGTGTVITVLAGTEEHRP